MHLFNPDTQTVTFQIPLEQVFHFVECATAQFSTAEPQPQGYASAHSLFAATPAERAFLLPALSQAAHGAACLFDKSAVATVPAGTDGTLTLSAPCGRECDFGAAGAHLLHFLAASVCCAWHRARGQGRALEYMLHFRTECREALLADAFRLMNTQS